MKKIKTFQAPNRLIVHFRAIFATLTVLMLTGCQNNNTTNGTPVAVYNIDSNYHENLSHIVGDIDFIPLETNDSSIISNIRKIITMNDNYYILSGTSIVVFNKEGKWLFSKRIEGKGKGELSYIHDFCFDRDTNLCILDYRKILVFNRYNGQYLDSKFLNIDNNVNPFEFQISRYDNYFFYDQKAFEEGNYEIGNEYSIFSFSPSGKLLNKYFKLVRSNNGIIHFNHSEEHILVSSANVPNDTIYAVMDNDILPYCYINFNSSKLKESDLIKTWDNKALTSHIGSLKDKSFMIEYPTISGEFIHFHFRNTKKERILSCFINQKTKKNYVSEYSYDETVFAPTMIVTANNSAFISYQYTYEIIRLINENKTNCSFLPDKRRLELLDKLKNLKETDNPVLMIIKTKK